MNSRWALEEIKKLNHLSEINIEALLAAELESEKYFLRHPAGKVSDLIDTNEIKKHFKNKCTTNYGQSVVTLGKREEIDDQGFGMIYRTLKALTPWRKGPFSIFGIDIDAEWRSELKWDRIEKAISPLEYKLVLDVGANNGYYMYRMLPQKPKFVLGIDPVPLCFGQFQFLNDLCPEPQMHLAPWGIEHVKHFKNCFDLILFMGIIYHHKNPMEQLETIKEALRPGGQAIIETIGIAGEMPYALFPKDRYANMKNVFFVPTVSCLINWCERAHFEKIELISDTPLTTDEQRVTEWSYPRSLESVFDPHNPSLTIEGLPAPRRFAISVKKKMI